MVKRGLGSGLSALIDSNINAELNTNDTSKEKVEKISIEKIYGNKEQPRKFFDEEKLNELAMSIKENGIIQPIIVQKEKDGYMIIAGERRYRASKLAGLTEIPCIVKNYEPETLIKISLLENIQREDLNAIEEAETYDRIIKTFSLTQDNLAKELGKSRTYITNSLRLLKLSPKVKQYIIEGKLSHTSARALITLDEKDQEIMADKIINENLTTRTVEEKVVNKDPNKATKKVLPAEYAQIESNFKDFFGTKVKLYHGEKKGKIEITYFGDSDLERILNLLDR